MKQLFCKGSSFHCKRVFYSVVLVSACMIHTSFVNADTLSPELPERYERAQSNSALIKPDALGTDPWNPNRFIRVRLQQPYTNLYAGLTVIPFALSRSAFVSIQVYTLQGHHVAELLNQRLLRGEHKLFIQHSAVGTTSMMVTMQADNVEKQITMIPW